MHGSYKANRRGPGGIVAVWVEDSTGAFVKTVGRWAASRRSHLVAWTTKAGAADADAVSGATRADHAATLSLAWDLEADDGDCGADGSTVTGGCATGGGQVPLAAGLGLLFGFVLTRRRR